MPTALDVITDAFELLGIYSPGDSISSADLNRGLSVLNDMMDVWSNESLACFDWVTQTFTMVPGQYQYTVGPGGFVNGLLAIACARGILGWMSAPAPARPQHGHRGRCS